MLNTEQPGQFSAQLFVSTQYKISKHRGMMMWQVNNSYVPGWTFTKKIAKTWFGNGRFHLNHLGKSLDTPDILTPSPNRPFFTQHQTKHTRRGARIMCCCLSSLAHLGNSGTKTFDFPQRSVIYHRKALEISFKMRYDSKILVERLIN